MTKTSDVVLEVAGVRKRFCRQLRRSLRYGVADIARELTGRPPRANLRDGEFWALDDVSFSLRRGECLGLLGANGAGKSTLLKLIAGLIKPDAGGIRVRGRVGALIELGAGMHPLLNGRENIRLNAAILGLSRRQVDAKIAEIIAFADLGEFIDAPVQSYSSGMRVRLGFAVAAHLEPDLLLIDEVLAVGDTQFRMRCYDQLKQLLRQGTALAIVSHNSVDLERMCLHGLVLDKGRVTCDAALPEALSAYEASLLRQPVQSHGSRVARFVSITADKPDVSTLDTVNFRLHIQCDHPGIPLRILTNIISPNVGVLGSITSHDRARLVGQRDYIVNLCLPSVPLQLGSYALHFWLYGPEITDFFDSNVLQHIRVTAPRTNSFGYTTSHSIRFESSWAVL